MKERDFISHKEHKPFTTIGNVIKCWLQLLNGRLKQKQTVPSGEQKRNFHTFRMRAVINSPHLGKQQGRLFTIS